MFFPIPHPTYWADPGPLPVDGLRRWAWSQLAPLYPLNQDMVDQWKRHTDRLKEDADKMQLWADQQREYEIMMAQYQEQGEYWSERLPIWLHHMGLSYRRTVQERKDERPYIKVDYCELENWFFDEFAYYFWIVTWPLPYGLKISDFEPNAGDSAVAATLAAAFGTEVKIEFNDRYHDRPGLWIIAEHKAGRGQVPRHIWYQKLVNMMPKGAKPLAWPVGQGVNNRVLLADLGELHHLGIGGQTGGGKSNQINVILGTFLSRNTPADLRLFLVDFKRVELAFYKGLPHLGGDVPWIDAFTSDIVIDMAAENEDEEEQEDPISIRTVRADYEPDAGEKLNKPLGRQIVTQGKPLLKLLDYILSEIHRRMALMEGHVKKVSQWNKRHPKDKLSEWVLVVDELGDIMLQPGISKKVERRLVRIMQLGRAAGVHCILATQTPKTSVITQLIQNNLIAWVVTRTGSGIASGLMLDGKHTAAKLPPIKGRCLFRQAGDIFEVQTPEISDLTIRQIVKAAKSGEAAAAPPKYTIEPDVIFAYALSELGGFCGYRELADHFRKDGVSEKEIRQILKDYTVAGSPPALEPEIPIGEEYFYLAPFVTGSRTPRQLIKVDQFVKEFDEKWAALVIKQDDDTSQNITRRAARGPEISPHSQGGKLENPEVEEFLERV